MAPVFGVLSPSVLQNPNCFPLVLQDEQSRAVVCSGLELGLSAACSEHWVCSVVLMLEEVAGVHL